MNRTTVLVIAAALAAGSGCSSANSSTAGGDAATGGKVATAETGGRANGAGGTAVTNTNTGGTRPAAGGSATSGGSSVAAGASSATGGGTSTSASGATSGGASGGTAITAGGASQSSAGAGGNSAKGGAANSGGTSVATGGAQQAGGSSVLPGDEVFVSTTGSDSNPGTKDKPLKTIAAAQAVVRASANRGKVPIYVTVLPGTYYVGKAVTFTSADSGTQAAPITYRGNGTATLSGGARLELTWSAYKSGIMQATVPASLSNGLAFDVLFLNGQRQILARYPNYQAGKTPFGGASADAVSSTRVGGWTRSPVGGFVHALHGMNWGSQHYVIKGVSGGNLTLSDPFCNARATGMMNGSQVVEGILDELDAPGEWYFDKAAGVLYLSPPTGTDLATATIEVSGLETIVQFSGTSSAPVRWVNLDGFHYAHTARTFAKCNETILRSDWQIYRNGSLFVVGAEDTKITNSFFDNLGGNAVFVSSYNRRVSVAHNKFVGVGASAILFMGLSSAVRNPLFGYGAANVSVANLDKTPGPKTDDYPAQCDATDNLIHDIGDPQKQVAGVGIDMAQDITVSHNSIYTMPRAGINIGDGCWGGHIIEYNDVFDTVLETGDHGAFNSWGRDRFWDSNISTIESRVASSAGLELLDVAKPITLRNNRWRCDHGWDVDLDDGSSNYVITNNIFLAGGLKWREGYQRTGDNNMFAEKAKMSVHVWPKDNRDVFTHNIFAGYDPVNPNGWGKTVDYNLFTNAAALTTAHGYGVDSHSASGSPGYVDAANGNYQLGASSPALALGIKSIAAESYGVTSLSLRAQARTPFFGTTTTSTSTRSTRTETWRGATIRNLIGLNDQSAVGLGSDIGVILDTVPAGSQAATDGLHVLDVILQLNGQAVISLDDLDKYYAAIATGGKISLGIYRLQQDATVTVIR